VASDDPTPEEIMKDEQQMKRVTALADRLTPPLSQLAGEPLVIQMMAVGEFVTDWIHTQDDAAKALDALTTYLGNYALD
jgi:hypothetical protein